MKIISPDASGQIDCALKQNLLDRMPEDLPVAIVPISYFPNYKFVAPLTNYYVLMDFLEPHPHNDEMDKFWSWVIHNPPLLTFRRELREKHVTTTVKPIEWPCLLTVPPVVTKDEYDRRPIDVLFVWGYSSLDRPRLHGEIWSEGMVKHGLTVIDNWEDIDVAKIGGEGKPNWNKVWVTIYSPWYRRKPIEKIVELMSQAKITVSLPGNGKKTFRDTESVGTLMARHDDDMAFAFPWDTTNSIKLLPELEFHDLLNAVRNQELYELHDRYLKGQENIVRYRPHPYVHEYIVPEIKKLL